MTSVVVPSARSEELALEEESVGRLERGVLLAVLPLLLLIPPMLSAPAVVDEAIMDEDTADKVLPAPTPEPPQLVLQLQLQLPPPLTAVDISVSVIVDTVVNTDVETVPSVEIVDVTGQVVTVLLVIRVVVAPVPPAEVESGKTPDGVAMDEDTAELLRGLLDGMSGFEV